DDLLIQDVRLYGRTLSAAEVERLAKGTRAAWLASKPADDRTPAEKDELFAWWLAAVDPAARDLNAKVNGLQQEEAPWKARGTPAYVMQETPQEAMAYALFGGEYEKRRDSVKPDTPRVLPPMGPGMPKNRLGFAEWLLQPNHPLTARVTVNRFWQEVFG